MPVLRFALEINGPKSLAFRWNGKRDYPKGDIEVLFDDQVIGAISKRDELRKIQEFYLPDGSKIEVEIVGENITVFRGGTLLNGIADAYGKLSHFNFGILLLALFNSILGLMFYFGVGVNQSLFIATLAFTFAILYLAIAFWGRQGWTGISIAIYVVLVSTNFILWALWERHFSLALIFQIAGIVSTGVSVFNIIKKQRKD